MRATLITVLFLACGAPQVRSQNDLAESIQQFNDGMRWERFAAAATSIPPSQRAQFVDEMDERATDLKITDYEVVGVAPRGDREARVQIKLSWYKASEGTVHETHALQTWERHGKVWWMVDETRLRGAQMPGLGEPSRSDRFRSAAEPGSDPIRTDPFRSAAEPGSDPSRSDRFRSAAEQGSESPCGEGPPCGESLYGEGSPRGESPCSEVSPCGDRVMKD